jgi:hypothetical protein
MHCFKKLLSVFRGDFTAVMCLEHGFSNRKFHLAFNALQAIKAK